MTKKKQYKTIVAPMEFNQLDTITNEAIVARGHRLTGIMLRGFEIMKHREVFSYVVPRTVGSGKAGNIVKFNKIFNQRAMINGPNIPILKDHNQLDELKAFLRSKTFKGFSFFVRELYTENRETKQKIHWVRQNMSNGNRKMGLILHSVNGVSFQDMTYKDIVAAADDMVEDACKFENLRADRLSSACAK